MYARVRPKTRRELVGYREKNIRLYTFNNILFFVTLLWIFLYFFRDPSKLLCKHIYNIALTQVPIWDLHGDYARPCAHYGES
jgi:hypothetical protein